MNRNYKKGDAVLLIQSQNVGKTLTGRLCEVKSINPSGKVQVGLIDATGIENQGYFKGYTLTLNTYDLILATKEGKVEYQKELLKNAEDKVAVIKAEIEFLEKYDSMEEFVADKIGLLLKADTKESRVAILKTLKQSNLL